MTAAATVVERIRSVIDGPGGSAAVAVRAGAGVEWSRVGLVRRVDAVTAVLRTSVGSGVIAVCLPEGPDLAVAVLGAMGSGSAAPVRADLPDAALEAHLRRVGATAVIGTPAATAVGRRLGLRTFTVDADGALLADGDIERTPDSVPALDEDVALVLTTSGTTGEPKVVPLRHTNLLQSMTSVAASLGLTPSDRSLVVMPLTHIHGLVAGLLAPLAAGGEVFLGGRFDPSTTPAAAADFGATFVTAVPTIHRQIARLPDDQTCWAGRLRLLRSSSSPLPRSVADDLEDRYGVPVVEAYGMTEAAHQITSNLPSDARRGTVGPADESVVRVIDEAGEAVADGEAGDVVIRGDNVMAGYVGGAEVNDRAFVDGWFRTGDVGRVDADGHLELVGRTKEMINRGGETIAPTTVEEAIRSLPSVHDVAVFAAPHHSLGEQVAAAVVAQGGELSVPAVQAAVADRLGDAEVPRIVHVVDAIPVGPTGKVQRNRLAGLLAPPDQPTDSDQPLDTGDDEADAVLAAWAAAGVEATGTDADFIALGGDSLSAITVAVRLGERWGVELAAADLLVDPTVSGMVAAGKRADPSRASAVVPVPDGPSPAQRRLLAAEHLGLDRGTANMAFSWTLGEDLDVDRFRAAVDAVVRRHPALRTTYDMGEGGTEIVTPPEDGPALAVSETVQEPEPARERFEAEAAVAYDLAAGPLVRLTLRRVVDGWLFGLAYHHVVMDGRSRRVLLDDLAAAYGGTLSAGEVDRARADGRPMGDADRAWWAEQLSEAPARLRWPGFDAGRSGGHPTDVRSAIGDEVVDGLGVAAAQQSVTPTMVLVAAAALAAGHITGERSIVVGLPIDKRADIRSRGVGLTMDSVAVRMVVRPESSVAELLSAARQACLAAYRRSDGGLQEIRRAAGRQAAEPLVHVLVQVRTVGDELQVGSAGAPARSPKLRSSRVDLSVDLALDGHEPELRTVVAPEVADEGLGQVYARVVERALRSIVARPDGALSDLDLASRTDRQQAEVFGRGAVEPLPHASVDDWFRARAAERADALALQAGDRSVTFGDLDRRVERIARALATRSPRVDRVVAVLPRGVAHIALQLGAWRAGVTLVSVEPDQPPSQIETRVGVAGPDLVIREADTGPAVNDVPEISMSDLESGAGPERPRDEDAEGRPMRSDPDAPAWGCFTSGSTGVPDLVVGNQRQLAHLVHAWHAAVPPEAIGVATASKPVSGIGYVSEWLVPLLAGATVLVFDPITVRDPFRTVRRLRDHQVTWYRGTPHLLETVARHLLDRGEVDDRVRFVVSGGDTLTRSAAELIARAFPAARIVNQYGCTEGTSESTLGEVRAGAADPDVGRPLAGSIVDVVDAHDRRCAPGIVGELRLSGPFVAAPDDEHGRCHTGDRGWWDAGGRLHLVGRSDRRLSVNGNRIEAGEIETAFRSLPTVRDAVVAIDPTDERGLVAAAIADQPTTPVELRRALGAWLPRHAVPARVVLVDDLPTTDAGKVDRHAMAELLADDAPTVDDAAMPESVADIRAAAALTLGRAVETVDPRASLIDNGGDSFAAIELAERLQRVSGQPVDVVELLGDRPLADLAETLSSAAAAVELPGRLRHVAAGVRPGTVIWFPGGAGFDVEVRRLSHYLPSTPRLLAYPYPGAESQEQPRLFLRALVREIARAVADLRGPAPVLAGNSFGGVVAVEVAARLERRRPGSVAGLVLVDAVPIEERHRIRGSRGRVGVAHDVRQHLADRRRDDRAPGVRWERTFRASRLMLAGHRRTSKVSGVPAQVVATAERREVTGRDDLGWRDHLTGPVGTIPLAGSHGGLLVEPRVADTAPAVQLAIDRLFGAGDVRR